MSNLDIQHPQETVREFGEIANLLRRRSADSARLASRLLARSRRKVGVAASPDSETISIRSLHNWEVLYAPPRDAQHFDTIVADLDHVRSTEWSSFLSRAALAGCEIRHVAEYLEASAGRVSLTHFSPDHLPAGQGLFYRCFKRVFDLAGVVALLPFAAAAIAAAFLAILVTMGRPVLFTQNRVGKHGKEFRIVKLRTMRVAPLNAPVCATAANDRRITRVGAFLRRFRIDELPQLWNVFKGEMSLIGPRPEQPELVARYGRELKGFHDRHRMLPGITGWAQVMGGYAADIAESAEKLSFDLFYVKHASALLDIKIALRTVRAILRGNSAR
jgi:lipopolysaccharide/colanic/teichoic acid biosynthesis glycosyltransferase